MSGTKFFHAEESSRLGLRWALGLLLLFPYLIWLAEVREWNWPPVHEWMPYVVYASFQALLSAGLACVAGFLMFQGLQSWHRRGWAEAALLFPNIIPPLFLVMALFAVVTPWAAFPYGLSAVIVAHVILNSGLVAVALDRLLQAKLGGMTETAWLLGVRPWVFWRRVAWPQLRGDLACIFLFVFSLCFTSFSIPLLLSGERSVTLEVAIFDIIRTEGRWDKAVLLAAFQSTALLVLAWLLPRPFWPQRSSRASLRLLEQPSLSVLVLLPAALLVTGWGLGVGASLAEGIEPFVRENLPSALLLSAALGLSVGVLHLILFLAVAYVLPHNRLDRFLNGYLAPSPAITGFGLLLLPVNGVIADFIKLVLALTLISFPLLYRWIVHSALASLQNQIVIARSLGASWSAILFKVVWPQAGASCLRACGLAAVWACGDFALSGLLLGENVSVPMLMNDLLGNYRFEQAALLLIPLVLLSLAVYFFFVRAARYVVG
ncbi:MAG: ABC transporter permease subunit [Bdellovibrionales bacterium]|nr:ABC transporter permease subunit [Bdellovibrionales bacterium]